MKAIIMASDLKRLIGATKDFTNSSPRRVIHQYIKLEFSKEYSTVTAVAVDGYRLAVEHSVCSEIDCDFTAYIKSDIPKARKDDLAIIEIINDTCLIRVNDRLTGYKQPTGEFLNQKEAISNLTKRDLNFKIGFNGNLLISALKAAQVSCGGFKTPVALEFQSNLDPVVLRTNDDDIKLVLPIRLKNE